VCGLGLFILEKLLAEAVINVIHTTQFYLSRTQHKLIIISYILLANIMSINAIATESMKDPCVAFVLSGSKNDYDNCSDLLRKAYEERTQGIMFSSHLLWLKNEDLRIKFCNDIGLGKPLHMSLAFKALPLLDGAIAEDVLISLGKSINTSPELFLAQLRDHYDSLRDLNMLSELVGNLGPQYVDHPERELAALKKRRAAVRNVNNPLFENIKKAVIDELNTQIRELGNYLKVSGKASKH
jgi:hypothetical protein